MSLTNILKTFEDEREIVVTPDLEFIEKDKDGISLKGVLQRGRLKLMRSQPPRKQGVGFRPSSITFGFCKRLKVAQLAGLVEIYDERPKPAQQLVFDMGHAIHEIIQTYFWDIGLLKGAYKCMKCDKIYEDLLAPQACPSGKKSHTKKHLRYKEVIYKRPDFMISGRADGILVIEGEDHLMDIKSIANRTEKTHERQFCFEDLVQPKPEHIVQLNLYMWMSGIHKGHLLYVSKNDHKIKTFAIPYDYNTIRPYLADIIALQDAAHLLQNRNQVKLPPPCGRKDCKCDEFLSIS